MVYTSSSSLSLRRTPVWLEKTLAPEVYRQRQQPVVLLSVSNNMDKMHRFPRLRLDSRETVDKSLCRYETERVRRMNDNTNCANHSLWRNCQH